MDLLRSQLRRNREESKDDISVTIHLREEDSKEYEGFLRALHYLIRTVEKAYKKSQNKNLHLTIKAPYIRRAFAGCVLWLYHWFHFLQEIGLLLPVTEGQSLREINRKSREVPCLLRRLRDQFSVTNPMGPRQPFGIGMFGRRDCDVMEKLHENKEFFEFLDMAAEHLREINKPKLASSDLQDIMMTYHILSDYEGVEQMPLKAIPHLTQHYAMPPLLVGMEKNPVILQLVSRLIQQELALAQTESTQRPPIPKPATANAGTQCNFISVTEGDELVQRVTQLEGKVSAQVDGYVRLIEHAVDYHNARPVKAEELVKHLAQTEANLFKHHWAQGTNILDRLDALESRILDKRPTLRKTKRARIEPSVEQISVEDALRPVEGEIEDDNVDENLLEEQPL